MPNLIVIFLTGLLTGGITCAVVQGGLLATVVANIKNEEENNKTVRIQAVIFFIGAKLISHTILGFLLGLLGEKLLFSVQFTGIMLIIASLFMISLSLNMLSVHPFFRRFALTTPKFLRKLLWKQSKRTDLIAPIALGTLTIFIPCGITQAMMAQAIAYGNPVTGALILFSFILGTTPLFLLFGLAMTKLTDTYTQWFQRAAALLVIGMALWNLYHVSVLFGIDRSVGQVVRPIVCQIVYCDESSQLSAVSYETTKTPKITIRQTEYEVDNPYVQSGDEITLTITNKDGGGCIQYFTIPKLNIQKSIPVGKTETIVFTAPKEKGELVFSCSMGMYRGTFIVK